MLAFKLRFSTRTLLLLTALSISQPATAQEESRAVDGADYYASYLRATSLYDDGRYVEAAPWLEALAERNPAGDASLWYRLGRSHEFLDRTAEAIDAYRITLDLGYRYTPRVAFRVARLFAERSQSDSAFVWLERALEQGYDDRPGIAADSAFASLRGEPRFDRITGQPRDRQLPRDEGWRYDLDFLVAEARRLHAAPGRPAFSEAFDSAASALRERIPEWSNDRVVTEMGRLMALLGDGHTGMYGPGPDSPLPFEGEQLPVLFYQFEDGLHIVNAAGDARRWIGARVLAFGSRPSDGVLEDLPDYVHQDNAVTPIWLGVHFYLRRIAFLQALGVTDDPSQVTLTLRDRQGDERRVTLQGGEYEFRRKLRAPPNSFDSPPWYLRDVDRAYWLRSIPEANAVYWQFNQVRNMEDGPSIDAFADSLRKALERTDAANLIIDVRHNNGGNNGLLAPLLRTVVWWEQDTPGRRLFVITGRNTFSAAQNFINRVERWTHAIFVGEPSSSRPNFYGEETNVVLPFSRVRGSISTTYWQDSDPGDLRRWIAPHVPVALSSTDYFSNHDPAMAAVRQIIRESNEKGAR